MESGWEIAFIVLQFFFVIVSGYFVASLKKLEAKMERQDKRVDSLETKQAVEFERIMTTRDMIIDVNKKIDTIGSKIDIILDPSFFQRCPNIKKGDKL
jgi:uncharacterized protein YoxC